MDRVFAALLLPLPDEFRLREECISWSSCSGNEAPLLGIIIPGCGKAKPIWCIMAC